MIMTLISDFQVFDYVSKTVYLLLPCDFQVSDYDRTINPSS